jgi:hypothetical protein
MAAAGSASQGLAFFRAKTQRSQDRQEEKGRKRIGSIDADLLFLLGFFATLAPWRLCAHDNLKPLPE